MQKLRGCYSIKYDNPSDPDSVYAIDYGWQEKNKWTCSATPKNVIHWEVITFPEGRIPWRGYEAVLEHFGLELCDISRFIFIRLDPSPADLARMRREKEQQRGLPRLEMKNHRTGCPEGECADMFEAVL